ncbi:MAG: polysaccharide biosynthesis C-terminal domain-containing protein, partial [Clostridia bacterium]|nr:polysaccharide biosynthesis C-terminal domain-containing protein [Clostridia bacterium]
MQANTNANPLGFEAIPKLLAKFALPSIAAMVISSLYNIVDQIFIGNAVGYLGNAATNVSFPLTTISLAIALLIGVGGAARFSLSLGKGDVKSAEGCIGSAFWMAIVLSVIYAIFASIFMTPMLLLFGATENAMDYARQYSSITIIGMPFLVVTNVLSNLIRADGSPKYSMMCMVVGAVINTALDPILIFALGMGVRGAAIATVISQISSLVVALYYLKLFKRIKVTKATLKPSLAICLNIAALGMSNSLNQLAITFVQIVVNNSLTYYGNLSVYGADIPLAALGVVIKINSIFMSVYIGLNQG